MTRTPLPVFRADIQVVIEVSAASDEEAAIKLEAIAHDIEGRLDKSTFTRLPGKPRVILSVPIGDPARQ